MSSCEVLISSRIEKNTIELMSPNLNYEDSVSALRFQMMRKKLIGAHTRKKHIMEIGQIEQSIAKCFCWVCKHYTL